MGENNYQIWFSWGQDEWFSRNKTSRAFKFKIAIYFAEESKILDNYIKLGQPSCYVEYCMLCGERYVISDCHVINVHVHVYNMNNLITRTSVGYHYNKQVLHIGLNTLHTVISFVAQEACKCICYLTSECSTLPLCTYKPHLPCPNKCSPDL